ncbi:MAG: NAD-dependent epimerase [Candidatus Methylomirabilota bacterium]|nr:MAG: NAD-dependent epimerase [candidate division NC10 bacterium]
MKILVTGTAGFIGFHLARRLLARGDEVVGLDNINDYYDIRLKYARLADTGIDEALIQDGLPVPSAKHPNYRFVKQNLADRESLGRLFREEKFDKVCHLAAQAGVRYSLENPHAYVESNLAAFVNLIELCRRCETGHLVYASSSSVYGLNPTMPFSTDSDTDHPVSLYGATKKSNELIAHSYSHLFGLPTTGLRFFTVYGPWGRPDMAAFIFAKAIRENRPIDIFNHGDMERDFTYVDDIVEGVVRVIDKPPVALPPGPPFKVYNIGHGSPVRLLEFVAAIERALGRKAVKNMLPMQPGDVRSTWADTEDLRRDLDYQPATSVEEGIDRFIEWYLGYYK